jgi:hypothetical protein
MRADMKYWMEKLPDTIFIFSQMLPRLKWRVHDYPMSKIDKKRKHINNCIRRSVVFDGGKFISYPDIDVDTPGLYFGDGIHLSDVGYDFILLNMKELFDELGAEFWGEQVRVAENSADCKM